ncbi:MAG: hypothetical protein V2J16_06975, partial [Thermoleophilia bacterium]|nr:hypothetical protein [Thermoleophilia bacterium]
MTRLYTAFVGCKVSQADSEAARAELLAAGFDEAVSAEDADVAVVHTCAVTREAERKSRQLAHRLARRGLRVVVAGCAATRDPAQFEGEAVTPLGKRSWEQVAVDLGADAPATAPPSAPSASSSLRSASSRPARRTRHVLKTQDGCGG